MGIVSPYDDEKAPSGTICSRKMTMKTFHDYKRLFLTIINITPAFGIKLLHSNIDQTCELLEAHNQAGPIQNQPHPDYTQTEAAVADFKIPTMLQKKAQSGIPYEMRDVICLYVLTKPTDFRHLLLDNLLVDPDQVQIEFHDRQRKILKFDDCVIEEREILTPVR